MRIDLHDMKLFDVIKGSQNRVTHAVVTAKEDRKPDFRSQLSGSALDPFSRYFRLQAWKVHVPRVANSQARQPRSVLAEIIETFSRQTEPKAGFPDGAGREACARAVSKRDVERDTQDADIGVPFRIE
jgi:hypothetical protein